MRILILIQLLAGFVLAFLGVIVMFHLHVWSGLGVTLCGMYGALRAVHRSSYDKGDSNGFYRAKGMYDESYDDDENRKISQSEMDEIITKANKKES